MTISTQTLFDTVVKHLLTQNARSMRPAEKSDLMVPTCAYYGLDGLKCAIGCLIEPKHYRAEFEGHDCSDDRIRYALDQSLGRHIEGASFQLLLDLQSIHDDYEPSDWPMKLVEIAAKYELACTLSPPAAA